MIRRRWHSLNFYWQVYLSMALAFGCIIAFVEVVMEPLLLEPIVQWLDIGETWAESILWFASVVFPSLLLGYLMANMVMRKLNATVTMARRLSRGDMGARIETTDDEKDAFNQLARVFNDMADSLEHLLFHEKRLLADISHELRSPLTRMSVATALLPMQRDSDAFESTIRLIDGEIGQMDELVGLLLEQGRDRLNDRSAYSRVDLAELIKESSAGFALAAANEGKQLVVEVDRETFVWGYDVRIRMIMDNVLSNALFYAPENSRIEVSGKQMGNRVLTTIRDYGPGVPDKHMQNIFKAFFRVDQSRTRSSGGVGLGLALAKDAAIAMGGDIEARNAYPGLKVLVALPLYRPDENGGSVRVP